MKTPLPSPLREEILLIIFVAGTILFFFAARKKGLSAGERIFQWFWFALAFFCSLAILGDIVKYRP